MFIHHLREFYLSILYLIVLFFFIFVIHYHFAHLFSYFFFGKLLGYNTLYASQVYEIIFTNLYIAGLLTLLTFIPFLFLHSLIYFSTGLYSYEIKEIIWKSINILIIFILEFIIGFIIIFYITGGDITSIKEGDNIYEGGENLKIIKIISYGNITKIVLKFLIGWSIISIIIKLLTPFNAPRIYIPLILFFLSFWILPPDIGIQIIVGIILLIYLEIHIWVKTFLILYKSGKKLGNRMNLLKLE
jgi:Sec-independent protein secretion pathway component TatC